jgi:hypothetical protein
MIKCAEMPVQPGEPRRLAIAGLWKWTGELWGGPVPEDDVSRGGEAVEGLLQGGASIESTERK